MSRDKKPKGSLIFCPYCGQLIIIEKEMITRCPKCKKQIGPFFPSDWDEQKWEDDGGKTR